MFFVSSGKAESGHEKTGLPDEKVTQDEARSTNYSGNEQVCIFPSLVRLIRVE